MKTSFILLFFLSLSCSFVYSQIPNSGFENWTSAGAYLEADGWPSTNIAASGPFYPVTRSTDHYPASVGNYSIRIENNVALLPSYAAFGFCWNAPITSNGPRPSFPITGHPNSLTGYYKFMPQGGDTMFLQIKLYKNGSTVSTATLSGTATAASWTPFTIPFPTYTSADSAIIIIATYFSDGPYYVPHGNSVLYVDNLNFDNLILNTPLTEQNKNMLDVFPNPTKGKINLAFTPEQNGFYEIEILNVLGALAGKHTVDKNNSSIDLSGLEQGVYYYIIRDDSKIIKEGRIVLQK